MGDERLLDDSKPAQRAPLRKGSRLARALATLVIAAPTTLFLFSFDASTIAWSPDTPSYVEFHSGRQPLYGYFFNSLRGVGLGDPSIALLQIVVTIASLSFLLYEVNKMCVSGLPYVVLAAALLFPLNTFLLPFSLAFISESLFYPMLMFMGAATLRWTRTEREGWLISVSGCVVLVVFVRGAAIAILGSTVIVMLLGFLLGDESVRRTAIKSLSVILLGCSLIPVLLGRYPFQLSPPLSPTGFVFLPRVVMLPANLPIAEPNRTQWRRMNASFVSAGSSLSCAERSLFESQLQEAVRYYIGPTLLLGASDAFADGWSGDSARSQRYDSKAVALFRAAVRAEPWAYARSTTCHLWALLSSGLQVGNSSRLAVQKALRGVDAETWKLARFRTDYPLQDFDRPLKARTALVYLCLRVFSVVSTAAGVLMSLWILARTVMSGEKLNGTKLVWLLVTGWLLSHSLLIAISVYPDQRYVLANYLLQGMLSSLLVAGFVGLVATRAARAA
ncbi:MAG: hypothetical protein ACSLFQ_21420 [Thermoanaerobaculia bacterium]